MEIKITDPNAKAQGRKAGVTFNGGSGYISSPLNEGQVAAFHQWGYKVEGLDDEGKAAVAESAKLIDHKGDGDKALKEATAQAALEQRTVFGVTGSANPAPVATKGGK